MCVLSIRKRSDPVTSQVGLPGYEVYRVMEQGQGRLIGLQPGLKGASVREGGLKAARE